MMHLINLLIIFAFLDVTKTEPTFKTELCLMSGKQSRSGPAYLSMNIVIVECKMGEICTPSNSKLVGNELGYVYHIYIVR